MLIASPRSRFIFGQFGKEVRNPQSSPEIIDNRSFASAWNNMAFCIWTKGAELLVDPYSHSLSGKVSASLRTACRCYGTRTPATKGIAPGTVIFYLITSSLADQLGYDVHL
jgi:hypothetical protein